MTIANPQNREEFKEYVKIRLGAPVLQINVSDEQIDLCINDAFQWFHERNHFNGTERIYLTTKIDDPFLQFFKSKELQPTTASQTPVVRSSGMVTEVVIVDTGTGYKELGKLNVDVPTVGGSGSGLTISYGDSKTKTGGLLQVNVQKAGSGYQEGDQVIVKDGDENCILEITKIVAEVPLNGVTNWESGRNFIVMPDDVIGVNDVVKFKGSYGAFGASMIAPFLVGGMMGTSNCGGMTFDLSDYYALQQYLATLDWIMKPPLRFNFNQRTHRLFLESNNFNGLSKGDYLCFECDVKPSPDIYPDLWNDMFLKDLSTAYVKKMWGQNLTKYNQVQLPGGLNLNGQMIHDDAKSEIEQLKSRFSMDWQDPPMDMVG